MRILVCIKQVPGTTSVEVDEKTGVLKRDGVEAKMNPFDLYAIEQALLMRETYGGTVDVITMGPPQAEAVLNEAVYMGADRGVLISDRRFAGADVVATSYTLSQGIRKAGEYDLILCGKQTTDGDTAQVGPETAEFLGIEHIANVLQILEMEDDSITVLENLETQVRRLKLKLPCLLTIEKDANTPRLPSFKRKQERKDLRPEMISLDHFADKDPKHYGLNGSPTQVERVFPPEKSTDRMLYEGSARELERALLELLKSRKFL
ncbi:electron transfer flavoprotein subunit beta/FixA family protein [Roseburia hominis]